MDKIYIYLNEDSDVGEAIEKIRETKSQTIILIIPENNKFFTRPINLEIFKKEIDNLGKEIYLSTSNERIINLARHYHLPLFLEDKEENQIIIDVKPPKKKPVRIDEKIEEEKEKARKSIVFQKPSGHDFTPRILNFRNIIFKIIFYLLAISFGFLIIILILPFFQNRAQVIIETRKSELGIEEVITLDKNILEPDYKTKALPAEEINFELNLTQEASTTGKIFTQEKPLLKVTFFNYLERDIPLVAGTRLAYQNNIFRTTEKIIIPAKKGNEPGQISTEAIASDIHDDNLILEQGTDLNIPALENKKTDKGNLWSDVLKAKVAEKYDLTQVQYIGSVAPEDIVNIKLLLEDSLKKNIQAGLALKYPQYFYVFDPSLVEVEILNISHKVGEKTNKISASGKAKIAFLAVPQKEFDNFMKYLINQEILNKGQSLTLKELKNPEFVLFDFDKRKGIETIGVKAKAVLMPDLNTEKIKADIVGKSIEEVNNYLASIAGIDKVSIKIFPRWKNRFPAKMENIKIEIK